MFTFLLVIVFAFGIPDTTPLIVPDEVPSLLSVVYSNIPPIKKGTDSRIGWGFRLGDHADFQILLELGPQANTRPLANEQDRANKRGVDNNLRNTLYAQYLLRKKLREQEQQRTQNDQTSTPGSKWLNSWSQFMKQPSKQEPVEGTGEIDASHLIPPELIELYGKPTRRIVQPTQPTTTTSTTTTGSTTEALENVEIQ